MSLADRSHAHFPLWLELSGLPTHVNTVAKVAYAWTVFRRIVELDIAQNPVRPGYIDVALPDLGAHCGLDLNRLTKAVRGLRKALVLRAFLPEKDEIETVNALFQIILPLPTPEGPEAVRAAHPQIFLGAEWPPRYAEAPEENARRTEARDARTQRAVELYLNGFSMKINNIILDQLQMIADRYEPWLIEKVFERAVEREATTLSWILAEIRREDAVRREADRLRREQASAAGDPQ